MTYIYTYFCVLFNYALLCMCKWFVIVSLTWLAYFLSHDYLSYTCKFTRFFQLFSVSLWRRANTWNVRLYYPYRHYTNFFIFRFVSLLCLRNTLRVLLRGLDILAELGGWGVGLHIYIYTIYFGVSMIWCRYLLGGGCSIYCSEYSRFSEQ